MNARQDLNAVTTASAIILWLLSIVDAFRLYSLDSHDYSQPTLILLVAAPLTVIAILTEERFN